MTFTLRQLNRQPGLVWATCDREGAVRIRRRDGRTYTLRRGAPRAERVPWRRLMTEHRARVARVFPEAASQEQVRLVDRLIAGE